MQDIGAIAAEARQKKQLDEFLAMLSTQGGTTYPVNLSGNVLVGATLLDYYAGQALIGILSNPVLLESIQRQIESKDAKAISVSAMAFSYAFEMLQARQQAVEHIRKAMAEGGGDEKSPD